MQSRDQQLLAELGVNSLFVNKNMLPVSQFVTEPMELLYGLHIDRTSCTKVLSNQYRVLSLCCGLCTDTGTRRLKPSRSALPSAHVTKLREKLLRKPYGSRNLRPVTCSICPTAHPGESIGAELPDSWVLFPSDHLRVPIINAQSSQEKQWRC